MNVRAAVAVTTMFWFVLCVTSPAQSTSAVPQSASTPNAPTQLPDEKVDIEFHAPFSTSGADTSQEFHNKYFLGDWMGLRPWESPTIGANIVVNW